MQASDRTPLAIFGAPFNSVLIWVLLAAAVLSALAGHAVAAVHIAVIVVPLIRPRWVANNGFRP